MSTPEGRKAKKKRRGGLAPYLYPPPLALRSMYTPTRRAPLEAAAAAVEVVHWWRSRDCEGGGPPARGLHHTGMAVPRSPRSRADRRRASSSSPASRVRLGRPCTPPMQHVTVSDQDRRHQAREIKNGEEQEKREYRDVGCCPGSFAGLGLLEGFLREGGTQGQQAIPD